MPVQKTTGMPDLFCFSMRKGLRAMRRIEYSVLDTVLHAVPDVVSVIMLLSINVDILAISLLCEN